jgi:RNA polymerase sigma factor (sigma-70 family)
MGVAQRVPIRSTMQPVSAIGRSASFGNDNSMAGNVLAQAFMAHQSTLLRYLRARGAGEDAEDCLQDLWIRAQASADHEVGDGLAYLYRMAHNLMLDRYRAAHRRQDREASYQKDVLNGDGGSDDAPSAERILIGQERLREIDRVLAGLGARTEYIFRRHRVDEIAQRDIATELGITLSAIEKHLQKAYRVVAAAQRTIVDGTKASPLSKEPADGHR